MVAGPAAGVTPAAAVVLFHGGALRRGTPADLEPHVHALADHGVLAAAAGYRLVGAGAGSIADSLADVVAATARFVTLAIAAGVPRSRIAVGGSSAGAHLALVAVLTRAADVGAAVALNPAGCDLGRLPAPARSALEREVGLAPGRLTDWSLLDLLGAHGGAGLPPVLVHHGTADEVEPIADVRRLAADVRTRGGDCRLVEHRGARHGFHRHPPAFERVMTSVAGFLRER